MTTEDGMARLRAAVLALRAPEAVKRAPAPRSSVFGRAVAAVPDDEQAPASTAVLRARARGVETSALLPGTSLALLVGPERGPLPAELRRSAEQLVRAGAVVVALGSELPRDVAADLSRPVTIPLRSDDALAQEWAVLVAGPARRVAFLARQEQTDGVWRWLVTRDAVAVQRAGTAILDRVPFLRLRIPSLEDA